QNVRLYRDWILGVDSPSVRADNLTLSANMGYVTGQGDHPAQVELGREGTNGSLTLISNYWAQGLIINNWNKAIVAGNTIAPQKSDDAIVLEQNFTNLRATWNSNYYTAASGKVAFRAGSKNYNFGEWTNATGFDSASSCSAGP